MKFNNKQEIKDFCEAHNIKLAFSRTLISHRFNLVYESYGQFRIVVNSVNYQIEKQLFSPFTNITVLFQ